MTFADRDIRDTEMFRMAATLVEELWRPGDQSVRDAAELHACPSGKWLVFTGSTLHDLDSSPRTRICLVNSEEQGLRVLSLGDGNHRCPKFSPDGCTIAFLADCGEPGVYQLKLFDLATNSIRDTPAVSGWVEHINWSEDGRQILLGTAGRGADVAGPQGAVTSSKGGVPLPSWMPQIVAHDDASRWRSLWVFDLASGQLRQASPPDENVWEGVWCGTSHIVALCSPRPEEGWWYSASLKWFDREGCAGRDIFSSDAQLGAPVCSPSASTVAVIEGTASDRGNVAGQLVLVDLKSAVARAVTLPDVDVTQIEWLSDERLLIGGLRDFESVVLTFNLETNSVERQWASADVSTAGHGMKFCPIGRQGNFGFIPESFFRGPAIAMVVDGIVRTLSDFNTSGCKPDDFESLRLAWNAPDGLEIHGWLLRRSGERQPQPLVMSIHGGPTSCWRPHWLGRPRGLFVLMLLRSGYSVFLPNPRGSTGRGEAFKRKIIGDMVGADTSDLLSGMAMLVDDAFANPLRMGVIGVSYGGLMAAWIVTQDHRFRAAIAVAPITSHVSAHLTSNTPQFMSLFMDDHFSNLAGRYYDRSPISHASKVSTPTLLVCGALDRCTPPTEALQFYNALKESGSASRLVTYPEEGHGVRGFPAAIDYTARTVSWFDVHLASAAPGNGRADS